MSVKMCIRDSGEVAAADLVVMVHQIVLDGDKPTLKVDVAPAQANQMCIRDSGRAAQICNHYYFQSAAAGDVSLLPEVL